MLRQFVEDVGGRRDRVRPQEQRESAEFGGGDQAPRQRRVAVDVGVGTRLQRRFADDDSLRPKFGRLAVGVARVERRAVGRRHQLPVGKLGVDPVQRGLDRSAVHPGQKAQGEEIFGAVSVARFDAQLLAGVLGEAGHRHLDDLVAGEVVTVDRIVVVAGLGQVPLFEGVAVEDDGAPGDQGVEVRFESRRVHGHKHVGGIAGGGDVVVGDVDLEGGHAGQGSGRGADLGRVFGEGGQVVAEHGAGCCEAVAGELHTVTRVARKPDDDLIDGRRLGGRPRIHRVGHVGSSARAPLPKAARRRGRP